MQRHWLALLLLLLACSVQAHTLSVAHLDIAHSGSETRIELDLAIRDIALSFPLDANRDEQVTWGELHALERPLQQWVASGLTLSTAAGACALHPLGLATRRYDDGAYATVQLLAQCPAPAGTRMRMRVRYDLLFAQDPQHRVLVTLRQGAGVRTATVRTDARTVVLGAAPDRPFTDFLREGVHHILIGYDHLAFLLSLLLPAALLRQHGEWLPAEGFRRVLTQVLGIVTAFTLAHSLTLSLAALGWVTPASRWVEPAIAISVLLAAINNVRPLITRRAWVVGFGFGLIHGFGFAGALGELGLPTTTRLLALVGFNAGVELGQLVVVCAVLPGLFLLRRARWYAGTAMPLLSLGICAVAATWLWQRVV
ncbi:HupE/UreJ family protein [Lysobacter sp. P5_B9]